MVLEAVTPVLASLAADTSLVSRIETPADGFGNWFTDMVADVNNKLIGADEKIRKLAAGEAQSLHEVMIHLEEARLSFQLLVQVRNRALEAYQEVMRMQV